MTTLTINDLKPGKIYKPVSKVAVRDKPFTDAEVRFRLTPEETFMFLDSFINADINIGYMEVLGPTMKGWIIVMPSAQLFQENLQIPETDSTSTDRSNQDE